MRRVLLALVLVASAAPVARADGQPIGFSGVGSGAAVFVEGGAQWGTGRNDLGAYTRGHATVRGVFSFIGGIPTGAGFRTGLQIDMNLGWRGRDSFANAPVVEDPLLEPFHLPFVFDVGLIAPIAFVGEADEFALTGLLGPQFSVGGSDFTQEMLRVGLVLGLRARIPVGPAKVVLELKSIPLNAALGSSNPVDRIDWSGAALLDVAGWYVGARLLASPLRARGYYETEWGVSGLVGREFL